MLKKVRTGIFLYIWFLVACGAQAEPSATPTSVSPTEIISTATSAPSATLQAEPTARASLESPTGIDVSLLDNPQTILEAALAASSAEGAYHFEIDFSTKQGTSTIIVENVLTVYVRNTKLL